MSDSSSNGIGAALQRIDSSVTRLVGDVGGLRSEVAYVRADLRIVQATQVEQSKALAAILPTCQQHSQVLAAHGRRISELTRAADRFSPEEITGEIRLVDEKMESQLVAAEKRIRELETERARLGGVWRVLAILGATLLALAGIAAGKFLH